MSKSREGKDDEFYKGIIRQQKAEIRNLKKRIRRLEKDNLLKDIEDDTPEVEIMEYETCKECGKGILKDIVVADRLIVVCENCGWRSKAIKL